MAKIAEGNVGLYIRRVAEEGMNGRECWYCHEMESYTFQEAYGNTTVCLNPNCLQTSYFSLGD